MGSFFSKFLHELSSWGIDSTLSLIISLIVIAVCLPFTYIGFSIRKAIIFRYKKYKGYNIRKFERHAIGGIIILSVIESILYFSLDEFMFLVITTLVIILIVLGLMGLKITFEVEEFIDETIDRIFKKE